MAPSRHRTHPVARLLRRLGATGIVVALAGVLLLGIAAAAAVDLYRLSTERESAARQAVGPAPTRTADPGAQYRVRVVVSADGPFTVGVRWTNGDEVERSSTGEDVVVTRVLTGAGPYVSVGGQLSAEGTIRCRVERDGEEIDSRAAEGLYAVAVCGS